MLTTTLAGLRAHLLRFALTALAITLGVGFVSGTFVLTDTMRAGFDRQFTASADRVSVAVLPKAADATVPDAVLRAVRAVPGVGDAQGRVRGTAPLLGKDGRAYGQAATLGLSIGTGALRRYDVTTGRAPEAPGEVALGTAVAAHTGYKVGDTVRVLDPEGTAHSFAVTGLVDFGVDQEIGYRGAVAFTEPVAAWMTGARGFTEVDVRAAPGVPPDHLSGAVAAAAGPSYTTLTSTALAKRMARASGVDAGQMGMFFLAFAIVALFVAALVIYNTFNILIAQRVREMALLRCVGATRAQVFRGVLVESAVVGLVASVLGALVGVGLGYGGALIFGSQSGLSRAALTVSATPFAVGVPVGLAVTLLAALLPARAATRVPPVAALRTQPGGPVPRRAGILRTVTGTLLVLAGAAVCGAALAVDPGPGPFLAAMVGGFLVFFGVVALSPLIVRALSGVVGGPVARLLGVPGRLALENSRRNPRRAAITMIALTVGVTLMTMFSVALTSARATGDAMIDHQYPVDYKVGTQDDGDRPVPAAAMTRLRAEPRFAAVIEIRRARAKVGGAGREVGSVTRRYLGGAIRPRVTAGSLAGLRPGTVVLTHCDAKALHARVGHAGHRARHRTADGRRDRHERRPAAEHPPRRGRLHPLPRAQGPGVGAHRGEEGPARHRIAGGGRRGTGRRSDGAGAQHGRHQGTVHRRAEPALPAGGRPAGARDRDLADRDRQHADAVGGGTHPRVGAAARARADPPGVAPDPVPRGTDHLGDRGADRGGARRRVPLAAE